MRYPKLERCCLLKTATTLPRGLTLPIVLTKCLLYTSSTIPSLHSNIPITAPSYYEENRTQTLNGQANLLDSFSPFQTSNSASSGRLSCIDEDQPSPSADIPSARSRLAGSPRSRPQPMQWPYPKRSDIFNPINIPSTSHRSSGDGACGESHSFRQMSWTLLLQWSFSADEIACTRASQTCLYRQQ